MTGAGNYNRPSAPSHCGLEGVQLGRRAFLSGGALLLASSRLEPACLARDGRRPPALCAGLMTDLHYADKPPAGTRHYRETPDKLAEAATAFQEQKVDFLVELGDFIDAADSVDLELEYLRRIDQQFSAISPHRHYVLGNHCVQTLTKTEFLECVERPRSYYSFDAGGFHFVVLDSCFRGDGQDYGRGNFEWTDPNIPEAELDWLRRDLKSTSLPTVVFAHQRLDVDNHYGVKNGADVRRVLSGSGQVLAVFQGHSHANDYRELEGIHFCTLAAMVEGSGAENSGYARLELAAEGVVRVEGFRRQANYRWPA